MTTIPNAVPPEGLDMGVYVEVEEAEKISGLDERTLRRYAAEGLLQKYRSGKLRVMYRKADLLALIRPKAQGTTGPLASSA